MMTEQFWHSWLAFALLLGPILLAATSLAFSYYLSQRYLREMLEAFQRSRYFHRWTDSVVV